MLNFWSCFKKNGKHIFLKHDRNYYRSSGGITRNSRNKYTTKIEDVVSTISGIDTLKSTSSENISLVTERSQSDIFKRTCSFVVPASDKVL